MSHRRLTRRTHDHSPRGGRRNRADGATAAASPTSSAAATLSGPYVALGDSYAAGPGIANQEASSLLCLRSDHDYPTLVAQAVSPTAFTDVSCSGAITDDMTGSQLGAAPQFDALNAGDKLVTLTIGGNDAGFVDVVVTCLALALTDPGGAPCENHYVSGGTDQLAATFAQVGPKVGRYSRAFTSGLRMPACSSSGTPTSCPTPRRRVPQATPTTA
jgi:lysophospholipase L1-like esterase